MPPADSWEINARFTVRAADTSAWYIEIYALSLSSLSLSLSLSSLSFFLSFSHFLYRSLVSLSLLPLSFFRSLFLSLSLAISTFYDRVVKHRAGKKDKTFFLL
jgi:hypothetical protein